MGWEKLIIYCLGLAGSLLDDHTVQCAGPPGFVLWLLPEMLRVLAVPHVKPRVSYIQGKCSLAELPP